MKLADVINGPTAVLWIAFAVVFIFSLVLISGHGSGLIAGYNTSSKEEKEKYNEKKLCKVIGYGMAVIALLILIMGLFAKVLPAGFANLFIAVVILDCVGMIVLGCTICKK